MEAHDVDLASGGATQAAPASVGGSARRLVLLVALLGGIVAASVLVVGETVRRGAQSPSPAVRIEAAPADGWRLLEAPSGRPVGFPEPMIRVADGAICFGLSRVDYAIPRPSLARCADHAPQPADALMLVTTITSGADRWHVFQFGDDLREVRVIASDDEPFETGRVHRAGSVAALRIPVDAAVAALEWKTPTATYRCRPEPDVVWTAVWCADADRG